MDGDAKKNYLKFLAGYQQTLLHQPFRFSFSLLFCIFVVVFNILNPYYLDDIQNGLTAGAIIAIIKRVFALLFWGYLSGLVVWPVFTTGYHIYKLSKHFEFVVHPRHPDRCGGLKPLGDFCFSMTVPIIISGIILILLGFGGITPVDISAIVSPQNETGRDTILFANILLFVFFLPLTIASFFLPLWNVHLEMARQKVNQEDEFSSEIMKLENELRNSVLKEKGWENAKIAKEKIEVLQVLNPQITGFPVWPFRVNLVISLFSPQILGIVGTILSLFDFFSA